MALPASRDRTVAPGGVIPAALANATQDGVIALYNGEHGPRTRIISAAEMQGSDPWIFNAKDDPPAALRGWTARSSVTAGSDNSVVMVPIPLEVGQRVTGVRINV